MLWDDTRAQSIQIGAVLLFGVAIILLASWQAFGIPNQNEGIEFNHNQELQQQLTELRTTANSMLDASAPRAATVDLGVRYPSRTLFVNPPPAAGTIRSVETTNPEYNITIRNGTPEDTNLRQLWRDLGPDGNDTISLNTGAIAYDPGYNEYQNPPQTIYEHSVLYNLFALEDQTLALTGQSLIKDDRITLVTLNGTLSENRIDSASVDFEPLSTQTRTVEINASNGPLTLEFPTRLAISEWRSLLGDQYNVTDVTDDPFAQNDEVQTVQIQANSSSETYQLQLAKVGVGVGTTQPEAAYVTTVDRNSEPVTVGDTYEVTVEVRDKYNKPKSGVRVNASATLDTDFADGTGRTDSEGRVTFEYTPDESPNETAQLNFTIQDGYDPQAGTSHEVDSPRNLTIDVNVQGIDTDDGTGNAGPVDLEWVEPGLSGESDNYTFEFNRTAGDDNQINLTVQTIPVNISQFDVDFAANASSISLMPQNSTTNETGKSTVTLTADKNQTIALYAVGGSGGDVVNVTVINKTSTNKTSDTNAQNVDIVQNQTNNGDIVLQFRNNNQESVTFSRIQLNSYTDDNPPNNPNRGPIDRVIYNFDGTVLDQGDPLEQVTGPTISNGANQDLTFDTKAPQNGQYKNEDAKTGDTMIITVEFGDGSTRQYKINL